MQPSNSPQLPEAQAPSVPPAPQAPPAPVAAHPSGAVIELPGGAIPLANLPRTAEEVEGLRARREILRDQLSRASNRRSELVAQLNRDAAPEARVGTQQRLALLDERILQIEREQATTERQLSNAPPQLLSATVEQPDPGSTVHEDEAIVAAFGTFGLGVILTLFVGRLRRRRARKAASAAGAASLAGHPDFERMMQAVDAMAEEVERIGEGQRFVTQLLAGQRDPVAVSAASRTSLTERR